jgi:serine/threonine protein kinase
MIERIVAERVYYDIQEVLGAGLTSEVYRAYRNDGRGWTRHEVALKVLKSKKNVQLLKQEFQQLTKIQSKHCVRMLAWENLSRGPALVLESIRGLTLHELLTGPCPTEDVLYEILSQVRRGLEDLHRHHVFHGDLNLKNIMINREGVVKLIDFGFSTGSGDQYLTPRFASPERLKGAPPSQSSDEFSLNELSFYLLQEVLNPPSAPDPSRWFHPLPKRQKVLARWVRERLKQTALTTQIRPSEKKGAHRGACGKVLLGVATFILTLLGPLFFNKDPQYFNVGLRSKHWFQYSLNGLPLNYGPMEEKKLRKGRYRLYWANSKGSIHQEIPIEHSQTFLLQPAPETL